MEKEFLQFLNLHWKKGPLLLGLSGGPDSQALFHLLLLARVPFSVAHLDHGWREESAAEGEILQKMCHQREIPFYLKKISPAIKNLEEEGRKARIEFFKELFSQNPFEALVLGHHADDQAETVLKRVFEGSTLRKLKGLTPISKQGPLTIWRPLLVKNKKEIIQWLETQDIDFFEDKTNLDSRFLRGRMRTDLIPLLSKHFGKEVSSSLCRLGQSAAELDEHIADLVAVYREKIVCEEAEIIFDLTSLKPKTSFEWKVVIHDFFEFKRIPISSASIEMVIYHLQSQKSYVHLVIGKWDVEIRGFQMSVKPRKLESNSLTLCTLIKE